MPQPASILAAGAQNRAPCALRPQPRQPRALMRTFIRAGLLAVLFAVGVWLVWDAAGTGRRLSCSLGTESLSTQLPQQSTTLPRHRQTRFNLLRLGGLLRRQVAPCRLAWIAYGTWSNPDPTTSRSAAPTTPPMEPPCARPQRTAPSRLPEPLPWRRNPPQSVTQSVQLTCE